MPLNFTPKTIFTATSDNGRDRYRIEHRVGYVNPENRFCETYDA